MTTFLSVRSLRIQPENIKNWPINADRCRHRSYSESARFIFEFKSANIRRIGETPLLHSGKNLCAPLIGNNFHWHQGRAWSTFLSLFCRSSPHALTNEFDAVSIVNEAIKNGVCISRIANNFVPALNMRLRSDDGRSATVSFFKDFEQIMTSGGVERL